MVREKIARRGEEREIVYDEKHWSLLAEKRKVAEKLMEGIAALGLPSLVHGSVARGDVNPGSDVDVIIPQPIASYMLEIALEKSGMRVYLKRIVQATPSHTPKVYYVLDPEEKVVVSYPLARLGTRELEFYYFGGALELSGLRKGLRVPGVDKRLILIYPTPRGHREESILGRESEVARLLGISVETVLERVRVLSRRDTVGRTGVFVQLELSPEESIEEAVREIASKNPAFRRMVHVQ